MTDARLAELEFLARLERNGVIDLSPFAGMTISGGPYGRLSPDARIAIDLLAKGVVNDATTSPSHDIREYVRRQPESLNAYKHRIELEQWEFIGKLHAGQTVRIRHSHAAAVRRAELAQQIQRDRMREPLGILLDARYLPRDLLIALFSASTDEPLCIAYLDMNGLSDLNDTHSHAAGDEALRAYFDVVAAAVSERGEGYRAGGDEVVVLLPRTTIVEGAEICRGIARGVGGHRIREVPLSAAIGVTVSSDPAETPEAARHRADLLQKAAKELSRKHEPRIGALAVEGVELEEFLPRAMA